MRHVSRTGEKRNERKSSMGKPRAKHLLEGSRRRCEDNISIDLMESRM
jgi:hypothetical protein